MSCRIAAATLLAVVVVTPALAQHVSEKSSGVQVKGTTRSTSAYLDALRKNTTTAGKIALAEAAGPTAIARHATIIEMLSPTQSKTLRSGTNGWTCIADPKAPICADAASMAFFAAMMSKQPPNTTQTGISYMLLGDEGASVTDPFATSPTADWVKSGPHTMVVVPDAATLTGLPDNPSGGGPYVMWKGTPYAHVMVPAR